MNLNELKAAYYRATGGAAHIVKWLALQIMDAGYLTLDSTAGWSHTLFVITTSHPQDSLTLYSYAYCPFWLCDYLPLVAHSGGTSSASQPTLVCYKPHQDRRKAAQVERVF